MTNLRLEISQEIHDLALRVSPLHTTFVNQRNWYSQRLAMAMSEALGGDKPRKQFLMAVLGESSTKVLDADTFMGLWSWCKPYTQECENRLNGTHFTKWLINDKSASLMRAVLDEVARLDLFVEPEPISPGMIRVDDLARIGLLAIYHYQATKALEADMLKESNIKWDENEPFKTMCLTRDELDEEIARVMTPPKPVSDAQHARNKKALRGDYQDPDWSLIK
jgi:hypothetical protein